MDRDPFEMSPDSCEMDRDPFEMNPAHERAYRPNRTAHFFFSSQARRRDRNNSVAELSVARDCESTCQAFRARASADQDW